MKTIVVAKDFSKYPAGRFESDGPYSGERFRRRHLSPLLRAGEIIKVELDGVRGYGSSFLEEAFGGLIRDGFAEGRLRELLEIRSSRTSLPLEIWGYIRDASEAASMIAAAEQSNLDRE